MSVFPTLTVGATVTIDGADEVAAFFTSMSKRMARAELLPIMLEAMGPVVAAEKGFLGPHSKSGALEASLKARAGGGDRPGTISVFSTPTATRAMLRKRWGRGRAQQRMWAAGSSLIGGGRKSVFYARFLEGGHDIVRGDKIVGHVKAYPFAAPAMPTLEEQGEVLAEHLAYYIVNG
jgi:hypothetical protein